MRNLVRVGTTHTKPDWKVEWYLFDKREYSTMSFWRWVFRIPQKLLGYEFDIIVVDKNSGHTFQTICLTENTVFEELGYK